VSLEWTPIESSERRIIIALIPKKGLVPMRASKGNAQDVKAMKAALTDALRPPAGRSWER
jgi:hypothetical protein